MSERTLRSWYLDTFAAGEDLEGRALRDHILATLEQLRRLAGELA